MVTRLIVLIILAMYTNVKPLCFTPETNIILYVNYTAIQKSG